MNSSMNSRRITLKNLFLSLLVLWLSLGVRVEASAQTKPLSGVQSQPLMPIDPIPPAGAYILSPSNGASLTMGTATVFSGDTSDGTSFTWNFGDGTTASTLSATKTYATAGTYTVRFSASAGGFKTSSASISISVALPKPHIDKFSATPYSISAGGLSTLSWNVIGATSVSIDQGIGTVLGTSLTVSPNVTTMYTMMATNAQGADYYSTQVWVYPTPTASIVPSTTSPLLGATITVTPTFTGGTAIVGLSQGASNISINAVSGTPYGTPPVLAPTGYWVRVTDPVGAYVDAYSGTVTPQPVVVTVSPATVTVKMGQTQGFTATVSGATPLGQAVVWSVSGTGGGTITSSGVYTAPSSSGDYIVQAISQADGTTVGTAKVRVPGWVMVWKKNIVYVNAKEVAEIDDQGTHAALVDHLGSPRFVVNSSGVLEATQKFMPFGERLSDPVDAAKFAKGFTNHEQTDSSGLIYMQARFYAPWYGRFLSPDPARDQHFESTQSWNIYSYCMNQPTMLVDVNGMWPEWAQKISSFVAFGKFQTFDQNAKNVVFSQTPIGPGGKRQIDTTWGRNVNGDYIRQFDHRAIQDDSGSLLLLGGGANFAKNLVKAGKGALAKEATTTLYRAVGPGELADIQATRVLRNLGSAEGKYFTTSAEAASSYAKQAVEAFGDQPYTLLRTQAPMNIFDGLSSATVDRGIPAWVIPDVRLQGLTPEVLNSMPIPQ